LESYPTADPLQRFGQFRRSLETLHRLLGHQLAHDCRKVDWKLRTAVQCGRNRIELVL
jgi:hypothetical protein